MDTKTIKETFCLKGLTLSSIESFTGGLFAEEMTSISGASHFFKGAIVTYFTEEKVRLLGMTYHELDEFGVISNETATRMAFLGRKKLVSDICVSFTGNAGPDVMENKQAGTIYIGISSRTYATSYEFKFEGDRNEIRKLAVEKAKELLMQFIENN